MDKFTWPPGLPVFCTLPPPDEVPTDVALALCEAWPGYVDAYALRGGAFMCEHVANLAGHRAGTKALRRVSRTLNHITKYITQGSFTTVRVALHENDLTSEVGATAWDAKYNEMAYAFWAHHIAELQQLLKERGHLS